MISAVLGAVSTNVHHVALAFGICFSTTPPHHIDPLGGIATHTRLTLATTPNPGTRSVK